MRAHHWIVAVVVVIVALAVVAAIVTPGLIERLRLAREAEQRRAVIALPFTTAMTTDELGYPHADRRTYSAHGHLISDVGPVRLAVVGRTDSGESAGSMRVDFKDEWRGASSETGVGPRRFTVRYGVGEAHCTFSGIPFVVRERVLLIDGHRIDFRPDHPRVVFVLPDGTVREVVNPGADSPRRGRANAAE